MNVGSRHVPMYTYATLDNMSRDQVKAKLDNLQAYLGIKERVPLQKEQLIQWILTHQKGRVSEDQHVSRETALLCGGPSARSATRSTAAESTAPSAAGRSSRPLVAETPLGTSRSHAPGSVWETASQASCYASEMARAHRGRGPPSASGAWETSSQAGFSESGRSRPPTVVPDTARSNYTTASMARSVASEASQASTLYTPWATSTGAIGQPIREGFHPPRRGRAETEESKLYQEQINIASQSNRRSMYSMHKTENEIMVLRKVSKVAMMNNAPIPIPEMDLLINAYERVEVEAGTVLMTEGEQCGDDEPGLFVLMEGELGVYKGYDPKKKGIARFGEKVGSKNKQGAFIGESTLHYKTLRPSSVVAETKCLLWSFARRKLSPIVRDVQEKRKEQIVDYLRKISWLKKCPSEKLYELLQVMEVLHKRRGECVMSQGHMGNCFFIIEQGSVLLCRDRETLSHVTLGHHRAGEIFGTLALLQDVPRAADVVVESEGATLIMFEREKFCKVVGPLRVRLHRTRGLKDRRASEDTRERLQQEEQRERRTSTILDQPHDKVHVPAGVPVGLLHKKQKEGKLLHIEKQGDKNLIDGNSAGADDSRHKQLGTMNKPRKQQQEELLQLMRRKGVLDGVNPSREDFNALADSFMLHRLGAGDVVTREGVKPELGDRLVFLLERGTIGLFRDMPARANRHAKGRPMLKGFGTRISIYDDGDIFRNAIVPMNDAPPTTSFVCDGRTEVVSLDRQLCKRLFKKASEKRAKACFDMLRRVEYFKDLSDDEAWMLVENMGSYHFQRGDFVHQRSEVSDELLLIELGSCQEVKNGVTLAEYRAGDHLNKLSLLEDGIHCGDMVVTSDDLMLFSLPRKRFEKLLGRFCLDTKH
eukprot:TRINITY_DN1828_c1_g1_i1.p1 TRINITY_DN1828_c1_g1~~TRINITY_DN1828_c1_g1_i1.p1  ORF type:complete len:907 (+),score=202.25 TRINITY_DN1828_c1_g1_i1:91-2721(+)